MVGRSVIIPSLADQIVRQRFVTIVGPGGVGKTTVAVAVADRLLGSFKHFLANEYDRGRTKKRGGDYITVPLEFDAAEARYTAEPADALTPEDLFERQWATGVLERAVEKLRADLMMSGKSDVFERLHGFLIGEKEQSYAEAARTLGMTEGAVKVTVHRLRRRLRDLLRTEIAATVSDDSEIDDEIRYLMNVIAS